MAEVRISARAGQDEQVSVRIGDVLAVELPENPTTGYVWSVAAVPDGLAELPPDDDTDPGAAGEDEGRLGARVRRVLRFAADRAGTGELRLRHGRPWQPAAAEELVVAVTVEAAP